MNKFSNILVIWFLFLAIGCSALNPKPKEDRVAARAQERLDALVGGDFEEAYAYLSPGYRGSVPFHAYRPKIAGASNWLEAAVDDVSCESEESCVVTTKVTYQMQRIKLKNTRPFKEKWIYIGGEWWYYPQ
ncbi:hypothetical protein [Gilvimarinus xylanilyticus]|uniref:Lipoprotein n=1 Tax=Gilvimarinus xylanilyticus TaxID=2944139 RepID=A0A9X2I5N8_9GAMM|nr:hypothetical protein [Gilvimarinus xylanilyticus]MCP8899357.1 hypothetical protein [Gilvimarinus xylanilyticus]